MAREIRVIGIEGLPEITPGMELAALIVDAAKLQETPLEQGDVLVITQKVVSKAEGMLVDLDTITPSPLAKRWADEYGRDARLIEVALMQRPPRLPHGQRRPHYGDRARVLLW